MDSSAFIGRSPVRHQAFLIALASAWLVAVVTGFAWFGSYQATPGAAAHPPIQWPAESGIPRGNGCTVVMTLHPLCPCSQATVSEMARLLSDLPDRPKLYVVFRTFTGQSGSSGDTAFPSKLDDLDLWKRARALPGATVITDSDGRLTEAFGATTSGDVLAFGANGQRLYHGGLTASRGHEGDSPGRRRLIAALSGQPFVQDEGCVFGCPLHDSTPPGSTARR